eukprot:960693-Karenia_brevis.AAC.1
MVQVGSLVNMLVRTRDTETNDGPSAAVGNVEPSGLNGDVAVLDAALDNHDGLSAAVGNSEPSGLNGDVAGPDGQELDNHDDLSAG